MEGVVTSVNTGDQTVSADVSASEEKICYN